LEIELCGRGIEEIIPLWLRILDLKRAQKWHISVYFKLTPEANLLKVELARIRLTLENFVAKIDSRVYQRWGKDHHRRNLDNTNNDEEWKQLFQELGVTDRVERKSMKALLSFGNGTR